MTMEQFITDTGHTDTFAGIAECFTATDEQNIIIRVSRHSRLVWWMIRFTQILTEVHGKISQVFHHDCIILGSQRSYRLQFLFIQTNPSRIIRVAIYDCTNIAVLQITLQLSPQLITPIVIYIKCLIFHALHLQLHFLYRETGINKEHSVLLRITLTAGKERGKSTLHTAAYRYTSLSLYIHADKRFHECRRSILQSRKPLNVRITMCNTILQSLDLGIHTYFGSRQTRYTHFHLDKFHAALLFSISSYGFHFTNSSLGKVLYAKIMDGIIYQ